MCDRCFESILSFFILYVEIIVFPDLPLKLKQLCKLLNKTNVLVYLAIELLYIQYTYINSK